MLTGTFIRRLWVSRLHLRKATSEIPMTVRTRQGVPTSNHIEASGRQRHPQSHLWPMLGHRRITESYSLYMSETNWEWLNTKKKSTGDLISVQYEWTQLNRVWWEIPVHFKCIYYQNIRLEIRLELFFFSLRLSRTTCLVMKKYITHSHGTYSFTHILGLMQNNICNINACPCNTKMAYFSLPFHLPTLLCID